jgi:hypothetical protein
VTENERKEKHMTDTPSPLDALKKYIVKPSQLNKPNLIMLYGNPGSGKTHLAASISNAPGYKKIAIVDTENSTSGTVGGEHFNDDRIDIYPVTTHEGFETVLEALLEDAESDKPTYDAIIVDTVDVAQERAKDYFEDTLPRDKNGEINGFAVWGEVKSWTNGVFRRLQEAPVLGIAVLHSDREKLENGPFVDTVMLQGKSKNTVAGVPDIVGFTEREAGVTTVHVGSSLRRSTKNRFDLPDSIENPSMTSILAAIANRGKAATATKTAPTTKPAAAKVAPKGKGQ